MTIEQLYLSLPATLNQLLIPAGIILTGVCLSAVLIYIVSLWLVYSKAGRAGCLVPIPFINALVLVQIAVLPIWTFFLFIVPPANLLLLALVWRRLSKLFGRETWFGLGLITPHPLFVMILAFGTSKYEKMAPQKRQAAQFQPMDIRPGQA